MLIFLIPVSSRLPYMDLTLKYNLESLIINDHFRHNK